MQQPADRPNGRPKPWSGDDFRSIVDYLRQRPGGTPPDHRLSLLQARLQVRLMSQGVTSFTAFRDKSLREDPEGPGMQLLTDLTTINHTNFFREEPPLRTLANWLAARSRSSPNAPAPPRVWSAGCSAGQEPYSLAMLLAEALPPPSPRMPEIHASDVSLEMIRTAARAMYQEREVVEVPVDRLHRWFLRGRGPRRGTFRLVPEIRAMTRFQHFDLRQENWPIPADFDAILCRNVAIYFEEAERVQLIDRLARRLKPGGLLVVGNCEILPDRPGLLERHAPSTFRRVAPS